MGIGSRIAQSLIGLKSRSPELTEELKAFVRHPRALGAWLEAQSPWLNRRFLGVASSLAEPFIIGMGLRVERLAEEVCEVSMPAGLRNRGEGGAVHSGALAVLGEFAARLYWEHHLDLRSTEVEVRRVQVRVLGRASSDLRGVFHLAVSEREELLHKLRSEGSVQVESQTLIYSQDGRLIAEAEVDWELRRQLALGAGGKPHES